MFNTCQPQNSSCSYAVDDFLAVHIHSYGHMKEVLYWTTLVYTCNWFWESLIRLHSWAAAMKTKMNLNQVLTLMFGLHRVLHLLRTPDRLYQQICDLRRWQQYIPVKFKAPIEKFNQDYNFVQKQIVVLFKFNFLFYLPYKVSRYK